MRIVLHPRVRKFLPWLILLLALFAAFRIYSAYLETVPEWDGLSKVTLNSDESRVFYTFASEREENTGSKRALIMVTHGYMGSAATTIRRVGPMFNQLAEDNNLVIVYPNAVDKIWRLGDQSSREDNSDLAYFDEVLAISAEKYQIDSANIFLVGESQGAMASYLIACSGTREIGALISVVMQQPEFRSEDCRNTPSIPFMLVNSTNDTYVSYWGGPISVLFKKFGGVMSTQMTIDMWKQINGCTTVYENFTVIDPEDDNTRVELSTWEGCENAPMRHYTVINGGHVWPSADYAWYLRVLLGRTTYDIKIADEIWSFVSQLEARQ